MSVLVYRVCLTPLFHVTGPRHRSHRGDSESGLPDAKAPAAPQPPIGEFVLGKVSRIHSGGGFQDRLAVLALEQVVVAVMLGIIVPKFIIRPLLIKNRTLEYTCTFCICPRLTLRPGYAGTHTRTHAHPTCNRLYVYVSQRGH